MLERTSSGNWAYCLAQLGKKRLATAREGMIDRIERYEANPNDRTHFDSGAWFSENFNRVDNRILGARAEFNPLIPYAEQASKAGYLQLSEDIKMKNKPVSQLLNEIAEKDLNKSLWQRRVVDFGEVKTHNVPTDSLADDDTIVWLAQGKELARDYGLFLRKPEINIKEVTVNHSPLAKEDYARGFWLCWLDRGSRSSFLCDDRSLDDGSGIVFGVSGKSALGTSQKSGQEKVRIFQPSFEDVLNYSRQYVPDIVQSKFEKGLKRHWENK